MNTMQHHEAEIPSSASSVDAAAQARITPQEFARAMAALEARHEEAQQASQETLPIGEALHQLGLNVSPEAVWAEVQAQRERQAKAEEAKRWGRRKGRRAVMGGLAVTTVLMIFFGIMGLRQSTSPAAVINAPATIANQPSQGVLRTLAEVPDGQLVECKPEVLKSLLQGKSAPFSKVIVRELGSQPRNDAWLIVKHGGSLYLRGYIAAMSPQVMAQGKIQMYNAGLDNTQADGLSYLTPLTLRIGSFAWHGMGSEYILSHITVSGVRPDEYAGEKPEF